VSSVRFYHRTGRRSGVSYGPLTALVIFPIYILWLGALMLFWVGYALVWLLSAAITAGALAFVGLKPHNAFADELAAFVSAPDVNTWLRGRSARAQRRARQQAGSPPRAKVGQR
jgi:hypothetical protein